MATIGCGTFGPGIPTPDIDFSYACQCGNVVVRHEQRDTKCSQCGSLMHVRDIQIDAEEKRLIRFLNESHSEQHRRDMLTKMRDHYSEAGYHDPDWKPLISRIDEALETKPDPAEEW